MPVSNDLKITQNMWIYKSGLDSERLKYNCHNLETIGAARFIKDIAVHELFLFLRVIFTIFTLRHAFHVMLVDLA